MTPDTPQLDAPHLDVLVPAAEALPPDPTEERLAEIYRVDGSGGRHVRVNMVAAVDGAAWGPDHRSGSINDPADFRLFEVFRALADVVLIGAGTARAEGYTALDRPAGLAHLSGGPLELALVTRSGHVPPVLRDDERPPFLLTGAAGAEAARAALPEDRVIVVPGADDDREVDLAAGLDALAARGLVRVLCEGGPTLLGAMLDADLVDELCVTTTPEVVGAGPARIVAGPGPVGATSAEPVPARLSTLLIDRAAGTLLARWDLRRRA